MKTKIIATIGPKSLSYKVIKNMKLNGLDIARINTKWGNQKQWDLIIKVLNKLKIEIMIDIKNLKVLDWVNLQKINYLAVSYAQSSKQIKHVKTLLKDK